jgi:hypothetical protein
VGMLIAIYLRTFSVSVMFGLPLRYLILIFTVRLFFVFLSAVYAVPAFVSIFKRLALSICKSEFVTGT